jgi:hypothetical protein
MIEGTALCRSSHPRIGRFQSLMWWRWREAGDLLVLAATGLGDGGGWLHSFLLLFESWAGTGVY